MKFEEVSVNGAGRRAWASVSRRPIARQSLRGVNRSDPSSSVHILRQRHRFRTHPVDRPVRPRPHRSVGVVHYQRKLDSPARGRAPMKFRRYVRALASVPVGDALIFTECGAAQCPSHAPSFPGGRAGFMPPSLCRRVRRSATGLENGNGGVVSNPASDISCGSAPGLDRRPQPARLPRFFQVSIALILSLHRARSTVRQKKQLA